MAIIKHSTGTGGSGGLLTGPYMDSKEYELAMQQAQFDMAMAQRRLQMEAEAKAENAKNIYRFTIEVAENGFYMLRFQGRLIAISDPQELGETIIGSIASTKF